MVSVSLFTMARIISITPREMNTVPIPQSNVFGTEVQKYYADGVIVIIRTLPGKKIANSPVWYQVRDDGTLLRTHSRILNTETQDEMVTRFWTLDENKEIHEYINPSSVKGMVEIRRKE
jgi:hypothetical protein